MNKKGLTLVELLATIVVIAIISVIIFPNVYSIVKNKKVEISDYQEKIIKEAAESYVADYIDSTPTALTAACGTTSDPYNFKTVSVNKLIDEGYLSDKYEKYDYDVSIKCANKGTNTIYTYEIVE